MCGIYNLRTVCVFGGHGHLMFSPCRPSLRLPSVALWVFVGFGFSKLLCWVEIEQLLKNIPFHLLPFVLLSSKDVAHLCLL